MHYTVNVYSSAANRNNLKSTSFWPPLLNFYCLPWGVWMLSVSSSTQRDTKCFCSVFHLLNTVQCLLQTYLYYLLAPSYPVWCWSCKVCTSRKGLKFNVVVWWAKKSTSNREVWRQVTMEAECLDDDKGELSNHKGNENCKKSNMFILAKQQLCKSINIFCIFLRISSMTATRNFLIQACFKK